MATKKAQARPRREPMSRVDTAWLRMCRPTNPMMITGVLMFDEPMTLDRLKQVIRKRFLAYPRFLQKAVDTPAGASWVTDPDFDLDWHVRLSALPGRHDPKSEKKALERFTSQMASTPLDKTKPLWQFHLIERYGAGSALVARIHHSYADGIALVQVLLSLTDTSRTPDVGKDLRSAWLKKDGAEVVRRVGAIDRYVQIGGKMLGKGMEMMQDPTLATMLAKEGGEIGRELLHALSLSDDPPTLLRGKLGVSKRVAWAEPLDLEDVKAVGRACDADMWLREHPATLEWLPVKFSPSRPFPDKPYFRPLAELFQAEPVLFLEKSRDMMASWFFVGLFLHSCMTVGGREVLVQSQKEKKAFELIDYAKILYEQSDPRVREKFPVVKPVWDQADGQLEFGHGGRMVGIPGGAEQIRSYHPWGLMGDEAAFQPEAGESYNNGIAACQKIVMLSTAGPGWFADVVTDQI